MFEFHKIDSKCQYDSSYYVNAHQHAVNG